MLDLFWGNEISRSDNYRDYLRLEGFEGFRELHARSPGGSIRSACIRAIGSGPTSLSALPDFPLTVVAESFKNPLLTDIFKPYCARRVARRSSRRKNSILRLLKAVKRGGATGILLDLSLHPTQAATIIEGFGLKMCVTVLHAILAQRAGTLLFPLETMPLPDGTCRVIAHPPVEWPAGATPQEIAQRCWDSFEPILRANPHGWLWPYKHFRYRPRNATRRYPFYANDSLEFEELMRGEKTEQPASL